MYLYTPGLLSAAAQVSRQLCISPGLGSHLFMPRHLLYSPNEPPVREAQKEEVAEKQMRKVVVKNKNKNKKGTFFFFFLRRMLRGTLCIHVCVWTCFPIPPQ